MTHDEAINLLEVIMFCDVDELAKIKAIDMAIAALREQKQRESRFEPIRKEICRVCKFNNNSKD